MPQPKACHTVCHVYLLMTLLCFSASALPTILFSLWLSFCFYLHLHSSLLQILLCALHPFFYIFLTLTIFIFCLPSPNFLNLSTLLSVHISYSLLPNSLHFASHVTSSSLRPSPFISLSSLFPFCLLSEGTVRAQAGLQAVVKAAQTVTWSAWNRGPGAAQTQTAPTAPSGHPSLRLAVSLASPSLPEGIALEATKVHREAAKALALVRTVDILPLVNS